MIKTLLHHQIKLYPSIIIQDYYFVCYSITKKYKNSKNSDFIVCNAVAEQHLCRIMKILLCAFIIRIS